MNYDGRLRGKYRLPHGCLQKPTFWPGPHFPPTGLFVGTEFCSFQNDLGLPLSSRDTSRLPGHISALRAACLLCLLTTAMSAFRVCHACGPFFRPVLWLQHLRAHLPTGSQPLPPTNALEPAGCSLFPLTASHNVLPWQPWSWDLPVSPHPPPL